MTEYETGKMRESGDTHNCLIAKWARTNTEVNTRDNKLNVTSNLYKLLQKKKKSVCLRPQGRSEKFLTDSNIY